MARFDLKPLPNDAASSIGRPKAIIDRYIYHIYVIISYNQQFCHRLITKIPIKTVSRWLLRAPSIVHLQIWFLQDGRLF